MNTTYIVRVVLAANELFVIPVILSLKFVLTALYPADWAGFEPDSNQSENVIPVSIDRAGIQGSVKAGNENSVIPNNIPELTRIFPGTTELSTLKVDSGETSTGQMAHPSVSPSQITVKKPSTPRRK